MTTTPSFPNVIGSPGSSLSDLTGRATQSQIAAGRDGEIKTAQALAKFCRGSGPTVLHDLSMPMSGISANIDHIVVSGRTVRIIDSKLWRSGTYWTIFGHTLCGFTPVPHADKQTMEMASSSIEKYLTSRVGGRVDVRRPLIMIWPSTKRKALRVALYRPVGARAATSARVIRQHRRYLGSQPANPEIVSALVRLLKSSPTSQINPKPVRYISDHF